MKYGKLGGINQNLLNMKYKKKLEYLKARQDWWDRQGKDYQAANKKPGSVKGR